VRNACKLLMLSYLDGTGTKRNQTPDWEVSA
jgi:hypothetical protein